MSREWHGHPMANGCLCGTQPSMGDAFFYTPLMATSFVAWMDPTARPTKSWLSLRESGLADLAQTENSALYAIMARV